MFKKLFKKDKWLNFYVVITKDNPNKFLTLTLTKDECLEYCKIYLTYKNYIHYSMWCKMRNYNEDDESAINEYFINCVKPEDKESLRISQMRYTKSNLAGIVRMFGGCVPIGCSFDLDIEHKYLESKLEAYKTAEDLIEKSKIDKSVLDLQNENALKIEKEAVTDGKK